jgi:hypothetical protein
MGLMSRVFSSASETGGSGRVEKMNKGRLGPESVPLLALRLHREQDFESGALLD